jgi:hypothetical protein
METGRSAAECRHKAAECQRMAVLAGSPEARLMYADLARKWRYVAEQAAMLESGGLPRRPLDHPLFGRSGTSVSDGCATS